MNEVIEYRVRPVYRQVITRYRHDGTKASVETLGEFDNEEQAITVAQRLAKSEDGARYVYPHEHDCGLSGTGDFRVVWPDGANTKEFTSLGAAHHFADGANRLCKEQYAVQKRDAGNEWLSVE